MKKRAIVLLLFVASVVIIIGDVVLKLLDFEIDYLFSIGLLLFGVGLILRQQLIHQNSNDSTSK